MAGCGSRKASYSYLLSIAAAIAVLVCVGVSRATPAVETPEKLELPDEAVSKKVLDNGLIILAKHSGAAAGLAAIDIRIDGGSATAEEYTGSGITHLVEHMVFKGTKTRPVGRIEEEVKSYGGSINGSASPDQTGFQLLVPAEHVSDALALLKDMLSNAVFDGKELEKEKEVILKEIRFHNDEPQARLIRLVNERAYLSHPYKYPTIGYEDKLKPLTRQDAVKYYERTYVPNRMVVAVVGDIAPDAALSMTEKEFGNFRSPNYMPIPLTAEPPQIAPRELTEERGINLAYLAVGFHSTGVLDQDLFASDVLAMILGRGDNSRLNRALVKDGKMAYAAAAWNYTPRDPGLFVITATLDPANLTIVEERIRSEIRRLQKELVGPGELEGAKRMVLGDYIFSLQAIDEQAARIASDQLFTGSFDFARRYVEGVRTVTAQDLLRAAKRYLGDSNATTVRLIPAMTGVQAYSAVATEKELATIQKEVLPNGITLLVRRSGSTPTVAITAAMLGGLMAETRADNGLSNMTSVMLLKGTTSRDESKISGAIEERGGNISAFSGFNSFGINLQLLRDDLEIGLETLKDVLIDSTFPQGEIEKERSLILAAIRAEDDDIFQVGINALRGCLFGDSPYSFRYLGEPETVAGLTRERLKLFYESYCVAGNLVISVSGDIDPGETIERLKMLFGALPAKKAPAGRPAIKPLAAGVSKMFEASKEESLVMVGFETAGILNKDRYALEVLASVLSGSSGRLFSRLRNSSSLGYSLGCVQRTAMDTGYMVLYVATVEQNLEEVRRALIDQVHQAVERPVSAAELEGARRELRVAHRLKMQSDSFVSFTAAVDELYGAGYGDIYSYDSEIEKVTAPDVRRVAGKYLDLKRSAEVVISSKK